MPTPGYRAQLYVVNPDGTQTPLDGATSITLNLRDFPEVVMQTAFSGHGEMHVSEGFRKSLFFYLRFPRLGHVRKRGPWHQRLPREYLTRKERRRLRRLPWPSTWEGQKHLSKARAAAAKREAMLRAHWRGECDQEV